jgi:phosphohistidine phosphatase SixA
MRTSQALLHGLRRFERGLSRGHSREQAGLLWLAAVATCLALSTPIRADSLDGPALINSLRKGGYVIVMRHPSSPFTVPDKAQADPGNTKLERQLDDAGRKTAQEMGEAFRRLHIPVGEVLSSPTYRAVESVRLAKFGQAKTLAQLDDGGQSMQSNADDERSTWLRKKVTESPRKGTNTVIVTHTPNLTGAFGQDAAGVAAGEALIFHPTGKPQADLVTRIKIEEWPKLARSP